MAGAKRRRMKIPGPGEKGRRVARKQGAKVPIKGRKLARKRGAKPPVILEQIKISGRGTLFKTVRGIFFRKTGSRKPVPVELFRIYGSTETGNLRGFEPNKFRAGSRRMDILHSELHNKPVDFVHIGGQTYVRMDDLEKNLSHWGKELQAAIAKAMLA